MPVSEKELSMLRLIDSEFQREVLDKLVRLETKMDALAGNGQPGRMKVAEDKIAAREKRLAKQRLQPAGERWDQHSDQRGHRAASQLGKVKSGSGLELWKFSPRSFTNPHSVWLGIGRPAFWGDDSRD